MYLSLSVTVGLLDCLQIFAIIINSTVFIFVHILDFFSL